MRQSYTNLEREINRFLKTIKSDDDLVSSVIKIKLKEKLVKLDSEDSDNIDKTDTIIFNGIDDSGKIL